MITVLSPAKTLDFESPVPTGRATTPQLLDNAAELMAALADYTATDLGRMMKLSATLSELNAERNGAWRRDAHEADTTGTAVTQDLARQAILAFTGDVYKGLAAAELTDNDFPFVQEHVRILSGLYGVLRPLDLIMPHRLEMGTRLPTPRGENLYDFWSDTIAETVSANLTTHENPVVLNLASQEYFKAIDGRLTEIPVVTPAFKEQRPDGPKVVGIHAKRQRGRMTRFIIDNRIDTPEEVKAYSNDGYAYCDQLSSDTEWVFLR